MTYTEDVFHEAGKLMCDTGDYNKPFQWKKDSSMSAFSILFGLAQGGMFLVHLDIKGWFSYVFLEGSPRRHPNNCRYGRMLRMVRESEGKS